MKNKLTLSLIFGIFICSCNSSQTEKRLGKLSAKVDSLEKHALLLPISTDDKDRTYKFDWFDLGKQGHQIINSIFYISDINTSFKENGCRVTGTIGNITSMDMDNVVVECAIRDTTQLERVVSGYSEVKTIPRGYKGNFNVFIPTTKTNVLEIGILIKSYRM
jgi:hypothetical protein